MRIVHPIAPVCNETSRILILGSFPSVKSREQGFYYGHPQNRFWRVLSRVFEEEIPQTVAEKEQLLLRNHIALWDVIASCEITGSSDASISDVIVNDISGLLQKSDIQVIYCNGSKAYRLYEKYRRENWPHGILLPSTSPANAIWSEDALVGAFRRIKTALMRADYGTPYYALSDYAVDFYGKKLYRLSLDGGFTCPNRDGTVGIGGCIFCDAGGSGDFGGGGSAVSGNRSTPIEEQLANQKRLVESKLPKTKPVAYIAYFQNFTGTYGEVEYLRERYMEAIKAPEVAVLSIATRPDCLGPEVLELLKEMNQILPVWIELGLQTKHEKTADYIRRGYSPKVYERAIRNLNAVGITQIITHVILGLPGETKRMMKETVSYVAECGSTGIKLQLLHVLENTDLAKDYERGFFSVLEYEEYLELTAQCVELLPKDMVVHRLTGDGNKNHLIAPLWSADKKRVINGMRNRLSEYSLNKK